jgi:hypothetical protein
MRDREHPVEARARPETLLGLIIETGGAFLVSACPLQHAVVSSSLLHELSLPLARLPFLLACFCAWMAAGTDSSKLLRSTDNELCSARLFLLARS